MPGTNVTGGSLQARFDAKRDDIREMLDAMEENALALCGDLCELRLRLMWQDGMQEKIDLEGRTAR